MKTGLVLTGGGARAAYQAGVLDAVSSILRDAGWPSQQNPFDIICGTSAGALNATILACRADDFGQGLDILKETWEGIEASQVYRVDPLGMASTGTRWVSLLSFGWLSRKWHGNRPSSLLDNTPLVTRLHHLLDLPRLDAALENGDLYALAVTASSYTHGHHITFYQAAEGVLPWKRKQRFAWRDQIGMQHLLASSAIPMIFPAVPIYCNNRIEYCGDGAMRQVAPISPAIHLGADKVFVIGAGRLGETSPAATAADPTLAQIAGHAMSCIFLDTLAADMDRLERINKLVDILTPEQRAQTGLRSIEMLVVSPSQPLEEIASRHIGSLPRTMRALLGGIGATELRGATLASYLLFEASYARELMDLGRRDTYSRRDDVLSFFDTEKTADWPAPLLKAS
jgi:NTE family protein